MSSAPGLPAAKSYSAATSVRAGEDARAFLRRLIFYGFLLRAALALLLDATEYSRLLAPDEETYAGRAWLLALFWAGEVLIRPSWMAGGSGSGPLGYFYLNAAFFYVFGQTELPIKLTNAFLGAFTARYVYLVTLDIFGDAVGRRAAILYMFFPSIILWSTLNIRDVWVIYLILFICYKSARLSRGYSYVGAFQLLLALYALTFFRDYLFFAISLAPVAALVIGRSRNFGRNLVLAILVGLGIVLLLQQGVVSERGASRMSLEALSQARRDMATGDSAFHGNVDISTPLKALLFLPIGIAYFLFAPFPWEITSLLKALALPEMIFMYTLIPAMFRGVRYAIGHAFRDSAQLLLLTVFLTVSYALGEGNVGTLYRHRAQAVTFYLIFAAVGLELRNRQRQREAVALSR